MKAFYFLLALLPLALAKPKCECPLVNCLGDDAAVSLPITLLAPICPVFQSPLCRDANAQMKPQ